MKMKPLEQRASFSNKAIVRKFPMKKWQCDFFNPVNFLANLEVHGIGLISVLNLLMWSYSKTN